MIGEYIDDGVFISHEKVVPEDVGIAVLSGLLLK